MKLEQTQSRKLEHKLRQIMFTYFKLDMIFVSTDSNFKDMGYT